MLTTDRAHYVTLASGRPAGAVIAQSRGSGSEADAAAEVAYEDAPQRIPNTRATISAPHMHAMALDHLAAHLTPGARVLDVGCGSGYLTAAMWRLVDGTMPIVAAKGHDRAASAADLEQSEAAATAHQAASTAGTTRGLGRVVAIDHLKNLTDLTAANLRADGLGSVITYAGAPSSTIDSRARPSPSTVDGEHDGGIEVVLGDGRLGHRLAGAASYDAIHVGAAAPSLPNALVEQLRPGGRLFIPIGPDGGDQWIYLIDKDPTGRGVKQTKLTAVRYVPLTDA